MKIRFTLLLFLATPFTSFSQGKLSPEEGIINSTIKIECIEKFTENGVIKYRKTSGTGFIFSFRISKEKTFPVIVTNKHVIESAVKGLLYFKLKDSLGMPIYGKTAKVSINNFSAAWTSHPDTSVDLAICPLMPIITNYKSQTGKDLFFSSLPEEIIPSDSAMKTLTAMEEVIMIGYPYGLRDTINDLPIVRKGMSATPIFLDYNSKKEFLVDLPVFFGSSGSPILIYDRGSWNTKTISRMGSGFRVFLLGINYATYTKNFDGKIIPKISQDINDSLKVQTNIPLYNIGIIIKAERILDFKPLFKNWK